MKWKLLAEKGEIISAVNPHTTEAAYAVLLLLYLGNRGYSSQAIFHSNIA